MGQIYQNASAASNATNRISDQKAPLYINEGVGGYGDSTPAQCNTN